MWILVISADSLARFFETIKMLDFDVEFVGLPLDFAEKRLTVFWHPTCSDCSLKHVFGDGIIFTNDYKHYVL